MRTVRIYQPGSYALHEQIELTDAASHHVTRVLRMHLGEPLILFCGDNREFSASIIAIKKHCVTARIDGVETVNRESPCHIHLAQGIAKGDRMSFIIQKAVELGAASVAPLLTQHGSVKHDAKQLAKKHLQWQAIAISACEQSGRNTVPLIHAPCLLHDYLETCTASVRWTLDPQADTTWRTLPKQQSNDSIALLIGPEGGLNQHELREAKKQGFQGICLGPRILRTETATLAALSLLQARQGDL